jgi:hypothetical protein
MKGIALGRTARTATLSLALALATGCASKYMKGTPLYTGEYSRVQGPAEDRVNLWPLLYWHDPALSVLWPIGEYTDDHFALRPLCSVYKLDRDEHEYSVLWPLSEFDYDDDTFWILPFVWSRDGGSRTFTALPFLHLRWPEGKWGDFDTVNLLPFFFYSAEEHAALFPFYMRYRTAGGHSTHAAWPVFNVKRTDHERGWRLWPLWGDYTKKDGDRKRYALWPFIHHRSNAAEERWSHVTFPFYFGRRRPGDEYDLLLPLFYREREGDRSLFVSPAYAAGRNGEDAWRLAPPFFFQHRAGSERVFLSLPYCSASNTESGDFLRLVFPLFLHGRRDDERLLVTPLLGRYRGEDEDTWMLTPLLSWFHRSDEERDLWLLAPMARFRWGGDDGASHVLPFYVYDGEDRAFYTLPVSFRTGDRAFVNVLGPLFHYARQPNGDRQWHAFYPFASLYRKEGKQGFRCWPLYHGWRTNTGDRSGGYALWPLITWKRYPERRSTNVFPVFTSVRRWVREKDGVEDATRDSRTYVFPTFWRKSYVQTRTERGDPRVTSTRQSNRLWPLWRYRAHTVGENDEEAEFGLLGWLYDYRRQRKMLAPDATQADEYVRARILWRLMHYERLNRHSTLDVFPFITYDRRRDTGFKKVSFAWRLFRYECDGKGGRKLDVLFLPLLR